MNSPRVRNRRRLLVAGLTVAVMATLLLGSRPRQPSGQVVAPSPTSSSSANLVLNQEPRTLAPGLHYLGRMSPAAAYAVETSNGLVLIDAGMQPDARALKRQLSELGLDWTRLRAILLTHAHADHAGGAQHLRRITGAKVHAGRGDALTLSHGGPREAVFSIFPMSGVKVTPTTVDVVLDGDEILDVGGVRFQALASPGHSPGSVCYLMERDNLRVLFSGDVIMSLAGDPTSASPLSKPLGTYVAYHSPRYRGDAGAFLSSLKRLRALPAPDLVLPGHPLMDDRPQSPRMTKPDLWLPAISTNDQNANLYDGDWEEILLGNRVAVFR